MWKDVWNSFPHVALLLCGTTKATATATATTIAIAAIGAGADVESPEIVYGDVVVVVW